MNETGLYLDGDPIVTFRTRKLLMYKMPLLALLIILAMTSSALAQGSIFGVVANSDLTTPANGQISFVGYLDDTDEEIRIETSDGAGYDNGNWFDDFQNYLTEAPGNPYDYHFYNTATGQAFQLSKLIPSNSFQQENILLGTNAWPLVPAGLTGTAVSASAVIINWNAGPGLTYHVYRRAAVSNGSFFRLDNSAGLLTDPGVIDSFYVDGTVDGVSSYDYLIIAEDASGNLSPHSAVITVNSILVTVPVLASINPTTGPDVGGTSVDLFGSNFDPDGVQILFGATPVAATVVSPFHLTAITPAGAIGSVDISVTNIASLLGSNTLVGGYTYNPNSAPLLAPIGPQTTTEGILLSFSTSASDIDGDIPVMTSSTLPGSASYVDNGDGTGSFNWTPTFVESGVYSVTFYATDGLLATDSEVVFITINEAGNQTPVLAAIGPQTVTENVLLSFGVSATDSDGTVPVLTTTTLPPGAAYTDNLDGTGSFTWTPDFTQAGLYNITFYAGDGTATDSEVVVVTVNEAGNQSPVLAAIGAQVTTENVLLSFSTSASDADVTIPVLTTTTLPTGASYIDNLDGSGSFAWTPDFTQSGTYNVTFYASDGVATDSEQVVITVNEAGNQSPVLAAIGAQASTEGLLLTFGTSATDPDATTPVLTVSTLPAGATYTDNLDGSGSFDWTPDFTQSGTYNVTFYASDGVATDSEQVVITVNEAGNQSPLLAAIGAQSVTEGIALNIPVSATDPDATIPTLSTSALPTGALFTDNLDGTGSLDWTPDFTQAGTYNVTFFASDGAATDSEQVVITVIEAGNQSPVLAAIGAQVVTEGLLLSVATSASDLDGTIPVLTISALPTGATYIDNLDGSGSFDWTPDFTQAGTYNVTFYASDGVATDSEQVVITVNEAGNQSPLLATIGAQSVTEGLVLNFTVSAADPDSTIPILSSSALPVGASFTDNLDGTGVFDWATDFTQAGTYNVTFYASDGVAVDSEAVVITVIEAGNQAPVLAAIGSQATTEGVLLSFGTSSSDADGTIPVLTTTTLPAGATYTDNLDGTGSFVWTPDFTQAGSYNITFYASDGVATDSEIVNIGVADAGNQAPILATIGAQSTTEGILLSFIATAADADGTIPAFSFSTLPSGATFIDNLDGSATFSWTPGFVTSGLYGVTFYVTDGFIVDSEAVAITVIEAGNQSPVLAAIGAQIGTENVLLSIPVSATDGEGVAPLLSTSALPTGASFVDNGNGSGSFDWTPGFTQSGVYNVTFYATDDSTAIDSELVTITINEAGNQPPVLTAIGAQTITEGIQLSFNLSATDAEGIPNFLTSALPTGALFTDNLDGTALFDWTPDFTQAGSYFITFYASDGLATDSEQVVITVNEAGNQPPVLTAIGAQTIDENVLLSFVVTASDPDGTIPVLTTATLPSGATYTDNLDGTGSFNWTPDFTQAGTYNVTFYVSDGLATDSEQVIITVNEVGNQTPVLAAIGPQVTTENLQLILALSATDPDGTIPFFDTANVPAGAIFTDNGDGTASFDWTPDFTQSGTYNVTFYARDGAATDSEVVTITVNEVGNQLPVLAPIGPQLTTEGVTLAFVVSATDAEVIPILTTSALPTGASFIDNLDGTGLFSWTPGFTQSGSYLVTFYAYDGIVSVSEVVVITVNEAGAQAPVINIVSDTSVNEGTVMVLDFTAVDPDGGLVFITLTTSMDNYSFLDHGDGSATFTYSPDYFDAGVDSVVFLATDYDTPQQTGSATTVITTLETNRPPAIDSLGPFAILVNRTLDFTVVATDSTDPDPTNLIFLSVLGVPTNATFVDNGDNTGSFSFSPLPGQEGVYIVTFLATDAGSPQLTVGVDVEITVVGVNNPPVLALIGPQTILEGELLTVNMSATDPDGTTPFFTLDSSYLQGNATFVDNGNGTATFTFRPNFIQAGLAYVTFFAHDGIDFDKEVVLIEIYEAGGQVPVFDPLPSPTVIEGDTVTVLITAFDPDTLPVVISVFDSTMPPNTFFVDSGNGTAVFVARPDYLQSGVYIIGITVSDGNLADTSTFVLTVIDAPNQVPVLDTVLDYTFTEQTNLNFTVSGSDLDGVPLMAMTSSDLPAAATLTDNGDGSGTFSWTAGTYDAGVYLIYFFAVDDTDPSIADSQLVFIYVLDSNLAPNFFIPPNQQDTLVENETITYQIYAKDPDSTYADIIAYLDGTDSLATNMSFTTVRDSPNNQVIGTLTFSPDYSQGANPVPEFYYVRFKVCDEIDPTLCRVTNPVTFRVYNINQPPEMQFSQGVGPFSLLEGDTLQFTVTGTDDSGQVDSLVARNIPANGTYLGSQSQKTFSFYPAFTQSGSYQVMFIVWDNQDVSDTQLVDITVLEAGNQAPLFTTVLDSLQAAFTATTIQTVVDAIDPDLDSVVITASLPSPNMSFTWSGSPGSATGTFSFTPDLNEIGFDYLVRFIVSDLPSGNADTLVTIYRVVSFMRGDADSDLRYTMNDIVYLITYLFKNGDAPNPIESGDADNNGSINVSDIAYMVNYLYKNGPAPPQ